MAVCLRLGVPLSDLVPPSGSCPLCGTDMRDHQDHIKLRRGAINNPHDSCQNGFARFARPNLSHPCHPEVGGGSQLGKVPDLDVVFADKSVLVDISGTDPLAPSIRRSVAGVPGRALAIRDKRSKYGVMAAEGFSFVRCSWAWIVPI